MSLRESINKHGKWVAIAILLGLGLGVAATVRYANRQEENTVTLLKRTYFSDDNGKSWFADDITKVLPFDHAGKLAYRAAMFRCGAQAPFCGYLQRPTEDVRKQIEHLQARGRAENADQIGRILATGSEVRRPGAEAWVPLSGRDGSLVVDVLCPDGKTRPEPVFP